MNKNVVYMITRTDGQQYIGITCEYRKRMSTHKKSKRFEIGIEKIEILKDCDTYSEAEDLEEIFIAEHDTFYNGLNESINGKGNHLAPNFNTKGFKYSEESKQKMRDNHWSKKMKNTWSKPENFSEETKKKWSEMRKGKSWGGRKIPFSEAKDIIDNFENDTLIFEDEFVVQFVKKLDKYKVGKVKIEELKASNGKYISKKKLYSEFYSKKYNVTADAIRRIIENGVSERAVTE
jgi:hypothetical protein